MKPVLLVVGLFSSIFWSGLVQAQSCPNCVQNFSGGGYFSGYSYAPIPSYSVPVQSTPRVVSVAPPSIRNVSSASGGFDDLLQGRTIEPKNPNGASEVTFAFSSGNKVRLHRGADGRIYRNPQDPAPKGFAVAEIVRDGKRFNVVSTNRAYYYVVSWAKDTDTIRFHDSLKNDCYLTVANGKVLAGGRR